MTRCGEHRGLLRPAITDRCMAPLHPDDCYQDTAPGTVKWVSNEVGSEDQSPSTLRHPSSDLELCSVVLFELYRQECPLVPHSHGVWLEPTMPPRAEFDRQESSPVRLSHNQMLLESHGSSRQGEWSLSSALLRLSTWLCSYDSPRSPPPKAPGVWGPLAAAAPEWLGDPGTPSRDEPRPLL